MRFSSLLLLLPMFGAAAVPSFTSAKSAPRAEVDVQGWRMQDASKVAGTGSGISAAGFADRDWYRATVPGTALTTLVDNKVYPEPLHGENNRPETIPDSLSAVSWWYRTTIAVPAANAGRRTVLHFEGINYAAEIWVNGNEVGTTRGAFVRGIFDITGNVKPGRTAVIAVLVHPQPHPGVPHEHTLRNGMGLNGGITALDGPTFLSTIGWDWIPAIRDRDTGLWRRVFITSTGPVRIEEPLVTTDLPLPRTDTADITVATKLENVTDEPQHGTLRGTIGTIAFSQSVDLPAHETTSVHFDPTIIAALHVANPKLWWPNGYGPQNLQHLQLSFVSGGKVSDTKTIQFGIRKITYTVPDSDNLTLSVNGVRVFIRGGNWGLDDGLKRIPRERLDAQFHLHALANLNMVRNWVGQSTSEEFYEAADKYGLLLWDEFFQPNPSDGPNPDDLDNYIHNVRDKVIRFRNHPSIAVWCARNEGYPPKVIDDRLRALMAELEPARLYQPSSTAGHGVNSGGPYFWRVPRRYYHITEAFKTETGSMSVPTLESIQGMLDPKDLTEITDAWAEHDFARGAQGGDVYPGQLAARYGAPRNLADFVRKAQLMNYEAYRAMYEGRNAEMFKATTGVLTWMSHPAQPSFVWQLYHYDLEANSSLFAVKSAAEPVHIQLNEATGAVEVVNNAATPLTATAHATFYALDGNVLDKRDFPVNVAASTLADLALIAPPATPEPAPTHNEGIMTPITAGATAAASLPPYTAPATPLPSAYLVHLDLQDSTGATLSRNTYWHAAAATPDDLTSMDAMPVAALSVDATRTDAAGATTLTIRLHNPGTHVALMTHLQLRRPDGTRVLPVYASNNYVTMLPGETRILTLTADTKLAGASSIVAIDGWNVTVAPVTTGRVRIEPNTAMDPATSPQTGLPFQTVGLR